MKQEAKNQTKKKEEGKKLWSAWETAVQITSSTTKLDPTAKKSTLRSRSLLVPGQKTQKRGKSTIDQSVTKLNQLTVTPRLTKSFVDSASSNEQVLFSRKEKAPIEELSVSVPSINNMQSDDNNSECFDLSIKIPDTDRSYQSQEETRSFLSVHYSTPRRSGGTPNSRRKPPTP